MSIHHHLLTAALVLALAGCAGTDERDPPPRIQTVTLPQSKFVEIDSGLTQPCPIAEGSRAEVFEVARKRREALETCNGQLKAIRELSEKAAEQSRGE